MSKTLEALDNIKVSLAEYKEYAIDVLPTKAKQIREENDDDFIIVETALKDYERRLALAKEYKDVNNVAKRLKALEIIKEKRVNVDVVIRAFYLDSAVEEGQGLKYYNCTANHESKPLTQEEYDLLKEVLLWK